MDLGPALLGGDAVAGFSQLRSDRPNEATLLQPASVLSDRTTGRYFRGSMPSYSLVTLNSSTVTSAGARGRCREVGPAMPSPRRRAHLRGDRRGRMSGSLLPRRGQSYPKPW